MISRLFTSLLAPFSSSSDNASQSGSITGLYRYAVKGLSADALESVRIAKAYDTFPDDRRFALLYDKNMEKWDEDSPEWLHKENFLCAFTNPKLLSQYEASYQISKSIPSDESSGRPCDSLGNNGENERKQSSATKRLLTLRDRCSEGLVWGPDDLDTSEGRRSLGAFFSKVSNMKVQCVTADAASHNSNKKQTHQFGNTSSGWKKRKDTRTIHIINANTVRDVAKKFGVSNLHPLRFRPNVVIEGWEPWSEFDFIGKTLQVRTKTGDTVNISVLSKTVRCNGVSIDPLDPDTVLDVPQLLAKHFPEHGPYLGVYAVIEGPGVLSVGDGIFPLE